MNLIEQVAGDDGNQRTYVELPDGRKLPLPFPWRKDEFTLPGNLQQLGDDRLFALYDETTRTGMTYCGVVATPCWQIIQPITREVFFDLHVPAWEADVARMMLEEGKP